MITPAAEQTFFSLWPLTYHIASAIVYRLSAIYNALASKSRTVNHVIMDPGHRDEGHVVMQQGTIEEDMRVHVHEAGPP